LGGRDAAESQVRLTTICDRLLAEPLRSEVTVEVLCSRDPAAYSWGDGGVFVTRGLIDLLDDE
jgi:Zn-dependent protease with chaperone function